MHVGTHMHTHSDQSTGLVWDFARNTLTSTQLGPASHDVEFDSYTQYATFWQNRTEGRVGFSAKVTLPHALSVLSVSYLCVVY